MRELAADVRIRPATRDDVPVLGRLGASLMRLHYAFDTQRFLAPSGNAEEGYGYFLGSQLRDTATQQYGQLRDQATQYYEQGRQRATEMEQSLEQYVHDKPIQSLLIAAGVGMLLGMLWKRS